MPLCQGVEANAKAKATIFLSSKNQRKLTSRHTIGTTPALAGPGRAAPMTTGCPTQRGRYHPVCQWRAKELTCAVGPAHRSGRDKTPSQRNSPPQVSYDETRFFYARPIFHYTVVGLCYSYFSTPV